ncbi:MAG TPA: hypothetical protein V6D50_16060 [Chroococcales cyanobacterium]
MGCSAVVGISEHIVDAIASGRPQAARVVLPEKRVASRDRTLETFRSLRPDVIQLQVLEKTRT